MQLQKVTAHHQCNKGVLTSYFDAALDTYLGGAYFLGLPEKLEMAISPKLASKNKVYKIRELYKSWLVLDRWGRGLSNKENYRFFGI